MGSPKWTRKINKDRIGTCVMSTRDGEPGGVRSRFGPVWRIVFHFVSKWIDQYSLAGQSLIIKLVANVGHKFDRVIGMEHLVCSVRHCQTLATESPSEPLSASVAFPPFPPLIV